MTSWIISIWHDWFTLSPEIRVIGIILFIAFIYAIVKIIKGFIESCIKKLEKLKILFKPKSIVSGKEDEDLDEDILREFRIHQEDIQYQRINFFLVAESMLLAAFATVYTSSDSSLIIKMFVISGFILSLIWWKVNRRQERVVESLRSLVRATCATYMEINKKRPLTFLSGKLVLVDVVPILTMLLWFMLLLYTEDPKLFSNGQEEPIIYSEFRHQSKELHPYDIKKMLKNYDFFDTFENNGGKGFKNQFVTRNIEGDRVIIDHASGLMWQLGGSDDKMNYNEAKEWIRELNQRGYAGHQDWRFPTIEEAMSLMESKKAKNDLYIDPIFNDNQQRIWTSDLLKDGSSSAVIGVSFDFGRCYYYDISSVVLYVRVVRCG